MACGSQTSTARCSRSRPWNPNGEYHRPPMHGILLLGNEPIPSLPGIQITVACAQPVKGQTRSSCGQTPIQVENMIAEVAARVRENILRVIVGRGDVIDLALVAILCEGHILIEDVPGIGKTTLARSIAASLGCTFRRIQFTPDLLPSDVVGMTVFDQKTHEFEFRPGPVVSQVLLADEINRATPRTPSALL